MIPLRFFAAGSLCAIVSLRCAAQHPQNGTPGIATVQIRVNTAYDDSPQSLSLVRAIALYVPFKQVPVAAGETLDGIFVREYGFGKSDLPKTYAMLLPIILQKNNVTRAEQLHAGAMLMPSIPKRVLMQWGRTNLMNYVANAYHYRSEAAVSAGSIANRKRTAPTGVTDLDAADVAFTQASAPPLRRTAPTALLSFELGLKQAVRLVDSRILPPGTLTVDTRQMPVKLAAQGNCDTEPPARNRQTIASDQRTRIATVLSQGSVRSPVVFILDTGWPSWDEYRESVSQLDNILQAVWSRRFGRDFKKTQLAKNLALANNGHCRCIKRVLEELRSLDEGVDPAKRVRVVYIPLTREQGADPVLVNLLATKILLDRQTREQVAIDAKIESNVRGNATTLVEKVFPERWVGEEVVTDKSIIDAVLWVGQAYASITNTPFFANESWTVRHDDVGGEYFVLYETPQFGLVTAAAGNDGTTNLLDFAQRSPFVKDTMAVLNIPATGIDRSSTRMVEQNIDISLALGFDGYITNDIYGTSFAAPRIAWFLAAGEAVRSQPVDIRNWSANMAETLPKLRDPAASRYQKLYFNPARYIESLAAIPAPGTH